MNNISAIPPTQGLRQIAGAAATTVLLLATTLAHAQITATFDFDNSTPALNLRQTVVSPVAQTDPSGVTATFSSPEGFSVQDYTTTFLILSSFSGKYLMSNHNDASLNHLDISFNQPLTRISLTFATVDANQVENPTQLQLNAYNNSTLVGSVAVPSSYANVPPDSKPIGIIDFTSTSQTFNMVELVTAPNQPNGVKGYLVDDINVSAVPEPSAYELATGLGLLGFTLWRQHKTRQAAASR